ncbi:MAG: helix-turn-helix domain-containing protein [Zetaproteobacteria bacterium]|nr:MAG: helix-turn-helix domain-containing protein [Zetaproteobacteria bacterium]
MSTPSPANEPQQQRDPETLRQTLIGEAGRRLRRAREEQGRTIAEISEAIKLSPRQIEALEAGDWESLPGPVFALSFLRQYADALGVDVTEMVQQLKSDDFAFRQPLTFPDPAIAPNRKWAIASGILFLLLLLVWNLTGDREEAPPPPPPPPVAQEQTAPPPAHEPPTPSTPPSPIAEPARKPAAEQGASDTTPAAAATESTPPQPAAAAAPRPPTIDPTTPATAPARPGARRPQRGGKDGAAPPAELHRFRFTAGDGRVWLRIERERPDGGRIRLREVILRPHHSLSLQLDTARLLISTGNAGVLRIEVDGATRYDFGTIGRVGAVVRHLQVTAPAGKQKQEKGAAEAKSR